MNLQEWYVYFVKENGETDGLSMYLTAEEVEGFVQRMEMYEEENGTQYHWGYRKENEDKTRVCE